MRRLKKNEHGLFCVDLPIGPRGTHQSMAATKVEAKHKHFLSDASAQGEDGEGEETSDGVCEEGYSPELRVLGRMTWS